MLSLKGMSFIITGASSGIGRETALKCARLGARVALLGRSQIKLEETFRLLEGGDHCYFAADLSVRDEYDDIVKFCTEKIGPLNGLVHAAGTEMTLPLKVLKASYYENTFKINTIAAFNLARTVSKKSFLSPEGASFVFISSIMSVVGQPAKIAYCASKGALVAGARAMALELASKKVRVNCISPGLVTTEMSTNLLNSLSQESVDAIRAMHPLDFGTPEDVANACVFFLSGMSKWITGINFIIDGGYSAQ